MNRRIIPIAILLFCCSYVGHSQSIARQWNDVMLEAIRHDYARPTVHARNLFHTSIAMYDSWAVFDTIAEPYFLGKTVGAYPCDFEGVPVPTDIDAARTEVMCYAMYRLIEHRFKNAPPGNYNLILALAGNLMINNGFVPSDTVSTYQDGNYKHLGNYLGTQLIAYGLTVEEGANEADSEPYSNTVYEPVNPSLVTEFPGNPDMLDPNRWQPLTLEISIDQSGNVTPTNTPDFLSPEWGQVDPFALKEEDKTTYTRDGFDYQVYHDPGPPPYLDTMANGDVSEDYKWGFSLVSVWSSHLDPEDSVMIDISPASIGNIQYYPESISEFPDFYNLYEGGDASIGHDLNPITQMPYEPQMVFRADYGRVLAEFWADGPDSETPPGHWYTLLNYVNDHPSLVKRFGGKGPVLDDLEWDVKSYFLLGGGMHDSAITAWGIKGWYDYLRPISALRYMADQGQSSDENLPSYSSAGIPLEPGYIELVEPGEALAGTNDEHAGKIKVLAWRGPEYINNPDTDAADVGWILAENWWPYQRPSFVTPPFAGYISGHSTYSRAGAEILTMLTGDPFFPGGMGEFIAPMNEFLVFEEGPSMDITLQWATYRDASDQCSLSRIWGGIHPPADDMPGRLIGEQIGLDAFDLAVFYFYKDDDEDGFYNYEDCNDNDNTIYPGAPELCDGKDNDCNDLIDDGLTIYSYYQDLDNDGYGDAANGIDTCQATPITGYVDNNMDCDDTNDQINPTIAELCDGIDNNCSGLVDDGLTVYTYYPDVDEDGYGDSALAKDTCQATPIAGYVTNGEDCDDTNPFINPDAFDFCDGIDNNCNGSADENLPVFTLYMDADEDSFGDPAVSVSSCVVNPGAGYVSNSDDCDDTDNTIYPGAPEIISNGIDEDCDGADLTTGVSDFSTRDIEAFPNPVTNTLQIQSKIIGISQWELYDTAGRQLSNGLLNFENGQAKIEFGNYEQAVYILVLINGDQRFVERVVKL